MPFSPRPIYKAIEIFGRSSQPSNGRSRRSSGTPLALIGTEVHGYALLCAHPNDPFPRRSTSLLERYVVSDTACRPRFREHRRHRVSLVEAGHRVAWVSTFEEATLQLSLDCPDLLVTAVRLGAFNGMHLLFRFRAEYPDVPVILIGAAADLTPDMRRHATRFLSPPIDRDSFVGLVSELLAGRTPHDPNSLRRWPRKRTELPATIHQHVARVVELSYGGLRLEMSAAPDDARSNRDRASVARVNVRAVPRWSRPVEDGGSWWCGAEIALVGAEAAGLALHRRRLR